MIMLRTYKYKSGENYGFGEDKKFGEAEWGQVCVYGKWGT